MIKKALGFIVFLILTLWVCGYGFFALHVQTLSPAHPEYKTDAIVVLTGGTLRISTGLDLFAQGMAPQLFITGVHNLVKDEEIQAMWHGPKPLPSCCITLGHDATSTIGNAQETVRWIKQNNIATIRLVTSSYHMPRAMLEFKDALHGMPVEIMPHPVPMKPSDAHKEDEKDTPLKFFTLAFDEYNKTLFRWFVLTLKKQGARA